MRGLLADINLQGCLPYLRRLLVNLDLASIIAELELRFETFGALGIPLNLDDRRIWQLCQDRGWVLLTENRNRLGPDSLEETLLDSWHVGHLPVLTLANKRTFIRDRAYAKRAAADVAEILFGAARGEYRDQSRIFVPR